MKVTEILENIGYGKPIIVEGVTPEQITNLFGREVTIDYMSNKPVALAGGKKNEMQGRVTKINRDWRVKFIRPGEYGDEMRKIPGQEDFQSKTGWGNTNDSGLIEKDGRLVVEVISIGKSNVTFLLDGRPIDKDQIIGLKPSVSRPEGQVPIHKLYIDNIQLIQS